MLDLLYRQVTKLFILLVNKIPYCSIRANKVAKTRKPPSEMLFHSTVNTYRYL